jgi:hypothetical protein
MPGMTEEAKAPLSVENAGEKYLFRLITARFRRGESRATFI